MQAKVDNKRPTLERIAEEAAEAHADAEHARRALEVSLCEADYWAVAAWSAILALPDYMETEQVNVGPRDWWKSGVRILDNYGDWSRVCIVDAEGRWHLRPQPDKVQGQRLDR